MFFDYRSQQNAVGKMSTSREGLGEFPHVKEEDIELKPGELYVHGRLVHCAYKIE